MVARVATAEIASDRIDDFMRWWQDLVAGAREHAPGFHGAYLLADREGGRVQSVALFDSPEALEAVTPRLDASITEGRERFGAIDQVQIWEVLGRA